MPQDTSNFQYLLYAIIGANLIFSFLGFNNRTLFDKYKFHVGSILGKNQYYRMISSAFLHGGLMHLAFNMFALYTFARALEWHINVTEFAILYFACLIVGSLLPLYFHKNEPHYSAIGASGAVSGVIYASVLFYPEGTIYLYFIPIKSWIFGILYLLYTMYSIRQKGDNIGHEAHLGGAVMGLIIAYILNPSLVMQNWWVAIILFVPTVIFFLILWKKPEWLNTSSLSKSTFKAKNIGTARSKRSIDDLYYNAEWEREKELNILLEKINQNGIDSLSTNEKRRLQELSK